MRSLAISEFKATCLAVLESVRRTGKPVLVTRRGVPVAQVVPPPLPQAKPGAFGSMAETVIELGDVVSPLPEEEWEALR
jgi:prevent-host-death family protein